MDDALHLIGVGVDLADAVRGAVGRRQRLLVDAGRRGRRAAERDIERFAVGARLNAARPLSELVGADRGLRLGVDHREIAGPFVGDVDAELRGRRGRGGGLRGGRRHGRLRAAARGGEAGSERDRERMLEAHGCDDTASDGTVGQGLAVTRR